jgi:hypothetical protein
MQAVIPSYQWFFAPSLYKVGQIECWPVLVCKLADTKTSQAEDSVTQAGDKTTVVATIESCHLNGEIVIMGFSAPMKLSCLVKLPCGTTKNHFKSGQKFELTGRLELWAKPELELDQNYATSVKVLEMSEVDEFGEIIIKYE